jgi:ATP-dependent protease ClpP protease subunit
MPTIEFSGYVGMDITPEGVKQELEALGGDDVIVKLNTPGGVVFQALEIYNTIISYAGKTTVIMGGLVASAGTLISQAFDERIAQDITSYMIHNVNTMTSGDAAKLKKEAEQLERLNKHMADIFASRTGKDVNEILELMEAETWYYGNEIVKIGFADKLQKTGKKPVKKQEHEISIQAAMNYYKHKVAALQFENKQTEEKETVNKDELLKALATFKQNGDLTLLEAANAMGLQKQIVSAEHEEALTMVNTFRKMNVDDPIASYKALEAEKKQTEKVRRENELTNAFGPEKHEDGKDNLVRLHAATMYSGNTTIEDIKKNLITKQLMALRADYTSDVNKVGQREESGAQTSENDNGPETVEY